MKKVHEVTIEATTSMTPREIATGFARYLRGLDMLNDYPAPKRKITIRVEAVEDAKESR